MKYIYIYVIAILLWASLPIFIYFMSFCKRNQQQANNERSNAEASEKNDTIIDRLEMIECATIIKVRTYTTLLEMNPIHKRHHLFILASYVQKIKDDKKIIAPSVTTVSRVR